MSGGGETRARKSDRPKVSVCTITYNHERFIRAAMDSVLAQQVDFDIELVVADDASTDGTQAIVREYAERYPGIIRPLLRSVNVGPSRNFSAMLLEARGDYVALLDGDDYWTAPHKLKTQIDFLEAHPDYTHAFHDVEVHHPDGRRTPYSAPGLRQDWTLEDILSRCGSVVPPASYVFRRGLFDGAVFPDWWLNISRTTDNGDWAFSAANAEHGKGRYFPEVMGVYRFHGGGSWSRLGFVERLEKNLVVVRLLLDHFGERHASQLRKHLTDLRASLFVHYARDGRFPQAARELALGYRESADWRARLSLTKSGVRELVVQPIRAGASRGIPARVRTAIRRSLLQVR